MDFDEKLVVHRVVFEANFRALGGAHLVIHHEESGFFEHSKSTKWYRVEIMSLNRARMHSVGCFTSTSPLQNSLVNSANVKQSGPDSGPGSR